MKRTNKVWTAVAAIAVSVVAIQPASAASLAGSGSTFAGSLIAACAPGFLSSSGNSVSYSGGGSGTGRNNADRGINDFNFSDVPFSGASSTLLHIPAVAAPIAIGYNLTGGNAKGSTQPQIYLSPKTLSDIVSGKITMWNDPAIKAENNKTTSQTTIVYKKDKKGAIVLDKKTKKPIVLSQQTETSDVVKLPAETIRVIYRSDSSGTTQNLMNYFQTQFPEVWGGKAGTGGNGLFVSGNFAANFPGNGGVAGNIPAAYLSASGSSGVATLAANTPYSLTYVESGYAKSAGLGLAALKNASGNYQMPDAGGVSAFLSDATITSGGVLTYKFDSKQPGAYVLGIVSYGLVDPAVSGAQEAAIRTWFTYLTSDKCVNADPNLGFAQLSGQILTTVNSLIAKI